MVMFGCGIGKQFILSRQKYIELLTQDQMYYDMLSQTINLPQSLSKLLVEAQQLGFCTTHIVDMLLRFPQEYFPQTFSLATESEVGTNNKQSLHVKIYLMLISELCAVSLIKWKHHLLMIKGDTGKFDST